MAKKHVTKETIEYIKLGMDPDSNNGVFIFKECVCGYVPQNALEGPNILTPFDLIEGNQDSGVYCNSNNIGFRSHRWRQAQGSDRCLSGL